MRSARKIAVFNRVYRGGVFGEEFLWTGGGGGGISITPVAFIVIQNDKVRMMQINNYSSSADRAIAMIPELVDQISQLVKAKDADEKTDSAE